MAGMKRVVMTMMRGGGDLGSVIRDEKSLLGVVSGKLIPSINNVAMGLLKWSYTEPNYTFPEVFSAWADLDAGFTQLLQEFLEECKRYRKSFKEIITESKKVSDVQREKEKTASKVSTTSTKLEAAKKTAKKNENNERAKQHVSSLEADLHQARAKDEETEEMLRKVTADFECYKASMMKESLIAHCRSLQALLQKGTDLCRVKMEIAESMPDEPAVSPDPDNKNNRRVEAIFTKHHLQLPGRDPTVERNLPAQRFKTLPPPQSKSPRITKQTSVSSPSWAQTYPKPVKTVTDVESEDEEDEGDYMVPVEDVAAGPTVKATPPELPPRHVAEEEDYVVPSLIPKSPLGNKPLSPSSPGDMGADYFQVISDEESDGKPLSPSREISNSSQLQNDSNTPSPVSEPLYSVPPDEEDEDTDSPENQLYGNLTDEELERHERASVSTPVKPPPYGTPRRPAVNPRPVQKPNKEAQPPRRHDHSMVSEEEDTPNKTGVFRRSPLQQQHVFVESDYPGHGRGTKHTYFSPKKLPGRALHRDSNDSAGEKDETQETHTYFNVSKGDESSDSDPALHGNTLRPDQTPLISDMKPPPAVAKKPVQSRKPLVLSRGRVK